MRRTASAAGLLALALALALPACDAADPAAGSAPTASAKPVGGSVCHYDAEAGAYVRLDLPQRAYDAHRAHGDGTPGDGTYDTACQPESEPEPGCAAPADGVFSAGGPIHVRFVSAPSPLRSELWFFGATNPGPDQTPFDTFSGAFLFAGANPQTSTAPGSGGVAAVGSPTADLNPGGMFAEGTELHFGIFVQDLYEAGHWNPQAPGSRGAWFYTGSDANNFDGRIHAVVCTTEAGTYLVSFEDACRTGLLAETDPLCYNTQYTADWDFDDLVFEVTVLPAPVP